LKLPRDISGSNLIKLLSNHGYTVDRQVGSHVRVTTKTNGLHCVTIPLHNPLKAGTLNGILKDIADHLQISKKELLERLFE